MCSIKIDCGYHRVGVLPEDALDPRAPHRRAARACACAGSSRTAAMPTPPSRPRALPPSPKTRARPWRGWPGSFPSAGLPIEEVSVGSTPSARLVMKAPGVTECRPGNYVFHDGSQAALGTCAVSDCAMTVLATVVSVPAPGRAVLDAGSKTLSSDTLRPRPNGHGLVLRTKSRLEKLSEEHGVLKSRRATGSRRPARPDPPQSRLRRSRTSTTASTACAATASSRRSPSPPAAESSSVASGRQQLVDLGVPEDTGRRSPTLPRAGEPRPSRASACRSSTNPRTRARREPAACARCSRASSPAPRVQ